MKLIIDVPDEIVKKGFEGPLSDEERQILIRAIGNGTSYERPQGEWVHLQAIGDYKCSICGAENLYKYTDEHERWIKTNSNFCPNCGADMRGVENEN